MKDHEPITISFDGQVEWILGRPNFACALIFQRLRQLGHEIPHHAEEEQAYSLFWMLTMYTKHGENWREEADKYLRGEKSEVTA